MEDFTAEDKSELSVKLGDCVVVMAKDPSGTVYRPEGSKH